jgi:hypothetical protein
MGLLKYALITVACGACIEPAGALDLQASADARVVSSNGDPSFLDDGLGKLRFDRDHEGLRLGRLEFDATQPIGEVWEFRGSASAWGDHDKTPVDVTEAHFTYRPYPKSLWRKRLKIGAFYAPVSLENRAAGWSSPYTLSSSAINTWLAEELRTVGIEGQLDWLGSKAGGAFDVSLIGAIYGWNDPAGVLIANHGFALHDRQSGLFGRVGHAGSGPVHGNFLFREIDGRPGFYAGISGRLRDRLELRALRYDNRADDSKFDAGINDFAWHTKFDSLGARYETDSGWTFAAQWLAGTTTIEPEFELKWRFDSEFALVSKTIGKHRLSIRHDRFDTHLLPAEYGGDKGHAWTAAYGYEPNSALRLMAEALRVHSDSADRGELGGDPIANETKFELSVRYSWTGQF